MTLRRASTATVTLLFALAITGCSGTQTNEIATYEPPISTATEQPTNPSMPPVAVEEGLNPAQKEQLEIALRRGGEKSASCVGVVPDAPRGEGEVKVTFDGKKGRAVDATVGPPFAGTAVESCIKRSFIGEIVVPFDGELEVPYTVKLPPKPGDDPKAKDPKAKDPKAKDPKKK
ncbi:MAG: hypothetical protein ABI193_20070 [Minicystis sp.]